MSVNVPLSLDNRFQNAIGYLDWEFKVEELPISPEDPKAPQTGDENNLLLWSSLLILGVGAVATAGVLKKKSI